MSPNVTLLVVAGVLVAAGVYLLLERSLTRILIGVLLVGNGVNVVFLVASGRAGAAAFVGSSDPRAQSDPLPQAMVLTAIVITMGVSAFLLTMAYRSFQLNGHDEVADDVEDARIRQLALDDLASQSYDQTDTSLPDEDGRALVRPEDEQSDESEDSDESYESDRPGEPEGATR